MPASRKIFVLSVVALACHCVALAVHSAIASNIIEFVLIVLASIACLQAAGRALATYYDSVLHASLLEWWPSDVLFLYHAAPMVIALFLADDSAESRVYRWQHWLDFLQIGIVSFSAYLFFLYAPMRTDQRPEDINALYWWVFTWRNFIVGLTFVLRAVLTKSRLVKSLFGRLAVFLALFGICDSIFVYAQTWRGLQFGTWYELLWTVPRVLMIWLATSWVAPKEPEPALKESSSESLLRAQFAHIAFPLLVLAMATSAARHYRSAHRDQYDVGGEFGTGEGRRGATGAGIDEPECECA